MHEVERRLFLDAVIRERAAVFQLFASEDESLLIGRDALLVQNLSLGALNRVRGLELESDRLASEGLDEDLHTSARTENQMQGGFFLNVLVRQRATIF